MLDISDDRWDDLVRGTDIFYQRDYMKSFLEGGNEDYRQSFSGIPVLIYYSDDEGSIVHPVFLRRWMKYYDIASPYCYSGPMIIREPSMNSYISEMSKFCRDNRIVSEFARLHPWLRTTQPDMFPAGNIFFVHLDQSMDSILGGMTKNCRNAITSAEKKMEVTRTMNVNALMMARDAYIATMSRNSAHPKYFFPKELFEGLQYVNATCFIVSSEGRHIASAIFLDYGPYCHYFLAGSLERGTNAGNLIIWEAIKYFKEKGCHIMNLGGTIADDSGIRDFKQSFSGNSMPFYVIKKVHNQKIYDDFCCAVGAQNSKDGFFPAYRAR